MNSIKYGTYECRVKKTIDMNKIDIPFAIPPSSLRSIDSTELAWVRLRRRPKQARVHASLDSVALPAPAAQLQLRLCGYFDGLRHCAAKTGAQKPPQVCHYFNGMSSKSLLHQWQLRICQLFWHFMTKSRQNPALIFHFTSIACLLKILTPITVSSL